MGTAHHLHVVHHRGIPPRSAPPLVLPLLPVVPLEPPPASILKTLPPPVTVRERTPEVKATTSSRCRERGCIFPARGGAGGKCFHHFREELEPEMYLSKQPTRATLDQGKFLHADKDLLFGSREADRRRLESEREAFFES